MLRRAPAGGRNGHGCLFIASTLSAIVSSFCDGGSRIPFCDAYKQKLELINKEMEHMSKGRKKI